MASRRACFAASNPATPSNHTPEDCRIVLSMACRRLQEKLEPGLLQELPSTIADDHHTSLFGRPPHPGCLHCTPLPCLLGEVRDRCNHQSSSHTHPSFQWWVEGWHTPALSSWPPAPCGDGPGSIAAVLVQPTGGGGGGGGGQARHVVKGY